jgi:energy-coupling factor transport system ATP-binding protein
VAEHADDVLGAAESCLVIEGGRVVARGLPGDVLATTDAAEIGIEAPAVVTLAKAAGVAAADAFDEATIASALAGGIPQGWAPVAAGGENEPADSVELPNVRNSAPVQIEVKDLSHTYPGDVEALRGVSLTIAPGESVAIVGQNGSGKSTLVKHLNGLLRPTTGQVLVGGVDTSQSLVSDLARTVGFVFQDPDDQLFNSRVDREVAFGPRNMHFDANQINTLVQESLRLTGLLDQTQTNPYDLDLSTRKLVALAGVLATAAPVLVLDEPTMGQDAPGKRRIGSIVDAWAHAGRTVVTITHDMEFAARHFGRIVVMRLGEIVLDGPAQTVFAQPNAAILESTGLRPPPAARIAALMGLTTVPLDAAALLSVLRPAHEVR